jgi:CRISP-associated protein Cas1
VVDRLVLRLCNLRILKPDDFEADPRRAGGVVLRRKSSRRFFKEWESALRRPLRGRDGRDSDSVRDRIDQQIESLATHLRHGDPYIPFRFGD